MPEVVIVTGNQAAAYGAKLSQVEVISAYPITPQTGVIEQISDFIAEGSYNPEFIRVESEHSVLAVCLGASLAGARTYTATSANGLLYAAEILHWSGNARVPIVMAIINRGITAGWNIWADQTDSLSQRDSGWMQVYCEDAQEIVDATIMGYKVAENKKVLLPMMACIDAFYVSHTFEPITVHDQDLVDDYLPPYQREHTVLDYDDPMTFGNIVDPNYYIEFKALTHKAMENAKKVIGEADEEFKKQFGYSYGGLVEKYRLEDAEIIYVGLGSICGNIKEAVDLARQNGINVGLLRLRFMRPFPFETIRQEFKNASHVVVLDKDISLGMSGIVHSEVLSALYSNGSSGDAPIVKGFFTGLGGRDVTIKEIYRMIDITLKEKESGLGLESWIGLREDELPEDYFSK